MAKYYPYGLIAAFFAILISPLFGSLLGLNFDITSNEKRELAEAPGWRFDRQFPRDFDNYFNDNFNFRTWLITTYNQFKIAAFNESSNPDAVIMGADRFLFYNLKSDGIYDSYTRKDTVTEEIVQNIYDKQLALKSALTNKNITYVLGFFPNKHTIYPEKFPAIMNSQVVSDVSLADQLTTYFSNNHLDMVDIRKALLEAKGGPLPIYRKMDTHWNAYGAYLGYLSFCEQTKGTLGLTPFELDEFNVVWEVNNNGDLMNMLGVESLKNYTDSIPKFTCKKDYGSYIEIESDSMPSWMKITWNKSSENRSTVLVFRDSYSSEFIPFLSAHYQKVVYIWNHAVNMELVDQYQADIVICLRAERYLSGMNELVFY